MASDCAVLGDLGYRNATEPNCCLWPGIRCNDGRVMTISLEKTLAGGSIPPSITSLTSLEHLKLSSNNLTGDIPKDLGKLAKLSILWLNGNQLTGSIPQSLADSTSFVTIYVDTNNLSGPIPPGFAKNDKLKYLSLSYNKLEGGIPKDFFPPNLLDLKVAYAGLNGSIPAEIGTMVSAKLIHMNGNKLSGEIPRSIEKLRNLKELYLDNNIDLRGELPPGMADLTSLNQLQLGNNSFTGRIDHLPFASINTTCSLVSITSTEKNNFTCIPSGLTGPCYANLARLPNLAKCTTSAPSPAAGARGADSTGTEKPFPIGLVVGLAGAAVVLIAAMFAYIVRRNRRLAKQLKRNTMQLDPADVARIAALAAKPVPPTPAVPVSRASSTPSATVTIVPDLAAAFSTSSDSATPTTRDLAAVSHRDSMTSLPSTVNHRTSVASLPVTTTTEPPAAPVPVFTRESIALLPAEAKAYYAALFSAELAGAASPPPTPTATDFGANSAVDAGTLYLPGRAREVEPREEPAVLYLPGGQVEQIVRPRSAGVGHRNASA
ncbi:hypothetical protein H9P43_002600 [Blastocladiella emersonii ATCC 22665]|nr:hypothetical protein H9P43_002600 [Blastocladiella emersonii ATCC 22665]